MKKKTFLVAIILVAVVVMSAVFVACVNTDLSDYSYPEGFEDVLSGYDLARAEDCDVRVMTFNMLVHMESWGGSEVPPRAKMFVKVLEEVKPDVIAAQEVCSDWHKVLEANIGDEYEIIEPKIDFINKNKTPVIYNKNTLDLIESGYTAYSEGDENGCRGITWGVFTVKATGKHFVLTSTHLDLIREGKEKEELGIMNTQADELLAKISELKSKYGGSVIACGDYNSMESGDAPAYDGKTYGEYAATKIYEKLADSLVDVKYKEGLDIICSDSSKAFAPTWDHIFVSGGAYAEKFFILDDKVFEKMSDHFAVFADIVL